MSSKPLTNFNNKSWSNSAFCFNSKYFSSDIVIVFMVVLGGGDI